MKRTFTDWARCDQLIKSQWGEITELDWARRECERINACRREGSRLRVVEHSGWVCIAQE